MNKVVLALSGGLDSTTLLADLIHNDSVDEVRCMGFTYGSRHNSLENVCAQAIALFYGVPLRFVDLSDTFSMMTSHLLRGQGEIPEGHYTDESMKRTVVPGRNMIFISIMAGYAWSIGADTVAIGIHRGDHAIYPDCRESFFLRMVDAVSEGTDGAVSLIAPFLMMDKTLIVRRGLHLKAPYSITRTCYTDRPLACGRCGSCVERLEAFEMNGISDPLAYAGAQNKGNKAPDGAIPPPDGGR